MTLLDARTIGVQPWEKKMVPAIEKAIRESDLGLNPATQGDMVRVPMPALTEERRKELIKVVKHEGENARGGGAQHAPRRDDHLKELLKKNEISEDDERRAAGRGAEDDRPAHRARSTSCSQEKEKELLAV